MPSKANIYLSIKKYLNYKYNLILQIIHNTLNLLIHIFLAARLIELQVTGGIHNGQVLGQYSKYRKVDKNIDSNCRRDVKYK